jgi:GNAT superfamily N-acetyltransferase
MDFPENANLELCEHYFGLLDDAMNEAMAGKRHFLMAILVVSPEYQRMGVGKALLESGLREADKEQVETWIDSLLQGLGLYKKLGWKEVGNIDIDLGKWGGEKGKIRRIVCMVRPPGGKEKAM